MKKKVLRGFIILYSLLLFVLIGVIIKVGFKEDTSNRKQSINAVQGGIQSGKKKKTLVAYFSHTGTTEKLALLIHDQIGGDIVKIEPKVPYTDDNDKLMEIVTQEQKEKLLPEIKTKINNFDDYSVIFVGYPIWAMEYPRIIQTFLETYNFDGKVIVPFNTYGGKDTGDAGMASDIAECKPKSVVLDPLAMQSDELKIDQTDNIKAWLTKIGLIK